MENHSEEPEVYNIYRCLEILKGAAGVLLLVTILADGFTSDFENVVPVFSNLVSKAIDGGVLDKVVVLKTSILISVFSVGGPVFLWDGVFNKSQLLAKIAPKTIKKPKSL